MLVSLPRDIKVKLGEQVPIEMDSDRPYTEFDQHKVTYPPGRMKKKYKKKKKWKY